jgi:hypothetical protein
MSGASELTESLPRFYRHARSLPASLQIILNLEHPRVVSASLAMSKAERERLLPDLRGVEVYVLGVDGAGKDIAYWQTLRDFWTALFRTAGAILKTYTVLRDVPDLTQ